MGVSKQYDTVPHAFLVFIFALTVLKDWLLVYILNLDLVSEIIIISQQTCVLLLWYFKQQEIRILQSYRMQIENYLKIDWVQTYSKSCVLVTKQNDNCVWCHFSSAWDSTYEMSVVKTCFSHSTVKYTTDLRHEGVQTRWNILHSHTLVILTSLSVNIRVSGAPAVNLLQRWW